jgi:hypothetical protein
LSGNRVLDARQLELELPVDHARYVWARREIEATQA